MRMNHITRQTQPGKHEQDEHEEQQHDIRGAGRSISRSSSLEKTKNIMIRLQHRRPRQIIAKKEKKTQRQRQQRRQQRQWFSFVAFLLSTFFFLNCLFSCILLRAAEQRFPDPRYDDHDRDGIDDDKQILHEVAALLRVRDDRRLHLLDDYHNDDHDDDHDDGVEEHVTIRNGGGGGSAGDGSDATADAAAAAAANNYYDGRIRSGGEKISVGGSDSQNLNGGVNASLPSSPLPPSDPLLQTTQSVQQQQQESPTMHSTSHNNGRFIIFDMYLPGQGVGNAMAGLLAAHLLGDEFNRTVCLSSREPKFTSFLEAFEPAYPPAVELCPDVLLRHDRKTSTNINLVNYGSPPNECRLRDILASSENDHAVLGMVGNTYPRWPAVPESNYFFKYYRPKRQLLDALPYDNGDNNNNGGTGVGGNRRSDGTTPSTVVHLRAPDNRADIRFGLDDTTLHLLGRALSSPTNTTSSTEEEDGDGTAANNDSTFLVSNNVGWYEFFSENYGWSHPTWDVVSHSALGITWNTNGDKKGSSATTTTGGGRTSTGKNVSQALRMWSDWYTILTAKRVYHTASDFSQSAIHWMNTPSKVIRGTSEEQLGQPEQLSQAQGSIQGMTPSEAYEALDLRDENWISDGLTPRLIDRSVNGEGKAQLRLCKSNKGIW